MISKLLVRHGTEQRRPFTVLEGPGNITLLVLQSQTSKTQIVDFSSHLLKTD